MAAKRRSLLVLVLTMAVVAWLTREAFESDDTRIAYAIAGALLLGTVLSGGWPAAHRRGRHPVVGPALTGVLLFVAFTVLGWLSSWLPAIDNGVEEVVRHARAGSGLEVALSAVAAGVAEEVFYRGALFERVRLPVVTTAFAHAVTTLLVGNVALTLAAWWLGLVLGMSRRASGGWWAPAVTHVVWGLLVLAWLPT